jgi:hypothetical protein
MRINGLLILVLGGLLLSASFLGQGLGAILVKVSVLLNDAVYCKCILKRHEFTNDVASTVAAGVRHIAKR